MNAKTLFLLSMLTGQFLIGTSPAVAQVINARALFQVRQAPVKIQPHIIDSLKENCDGSGGPGESTTLQPVSARKRAHDLNISLDEAKQVNTYLLQIKGDPCSKTLISDTTQTAEDAEPMGWR